MGSLDLKLSAFVFVLISCMILTVPGEDGSGEKDKEIGEDAPSLLVRRCGRRFRMMNMMNGQQQQQQQPATPATEQALRDALTNNACANYNPNTLFPFLNLTNLQALAKCKAAAQYLFMSSNIKRPDDCQTAFGVRCGQDAQGRIACMIKTQMGFLTYDEKPLSHCAQNFRPSDTTIPPNPNTNPSTNPNTNPSTNPNTNPSTNPNTNNQTPDNRTPDNRTPDNRTPENRTPENQTPDNRTPDNRTPDNRTPDNRTPDNTTPDSNMFPIRNLQNQRFESSDDLDFNDRT